MSSAPDIHADIDYVAEISRSELGRVWANWYKAASEKFDKLVFVGASDTLLRDTLRGKPVTKDLLERWYDRARALERRLVVR